MQFPTRRNDIVALAQTMVAGIRDNPADFEVETFAPEELVDKLQEFSAQMARRIEAQAQLNKVIEDQQKTMEQITQGLRKRIDLAMAKFPKSPDKLIAIGWNTPKPRTFEPPGQPGELSARRIDRGVVELAWKPPKAPNRTLRYYRVEVFKAESGSVWKPDRSYSTVGVRLILHDQEVHTDLEYRVFAVNSHGESLPTNTVAIVA